jgi:hypothetical protein
LPFSDDHFDTVFESHLFQFVVEPLEILTEMTRTSRDLVIVDENGRIMSGGEQSRELNASRLVGALLMRDGSSNRFGYPLAKQKRTLPAHDEPDAYLAGFAGRVAQHDIVVQRLDTILSAAAAETGPTQEGDRVEYPVVRR